MTPTLEQVTESRDFILKEAVYLSDQSERLAQEKADLQAKLAQIEQARKLEGAELVRRVAENQRLRYALIGALNSTQEIAALTSVLDDQRIRTAADALIGRITEALK